jgi:hypothetical protein
MRADGHMDQHHHLRTRPFLSRCENKNAYLTAAGHPVTILNDDFPNTRQCRLLQSVDRPKHVKTFPTTCYLKHKTLLMSYRCIVITKISHTHLRYRSATVNASGLKLDIISFQSQELPPTSSADVSNKALSVDGLFVENCALLGYYAASGGNSLSTFIFKGLDPRRLER